MLRFTLAPQERLSDLATAARSYFTKQTQFSSVQFSRSVVSDSLRPHRLQHARPPYPPGRHWGQEEKGTTEDEMAGWHHRLD